MEEALLLLIFLGVVVVFFLNVGTLLRCGSLKDEITILRRELRDRPIPAVVPDPVKETPVVISDAPVMPTDTVESSPPTTHSPVTPPPLPPRREPATTAARSVQPTAAPAAPVIPMPLPPQEPGRFETAAREALRKIWNWIVVGEDHRATGVTMEYAVMTTWLLRLGVMILVTGMGFFLRYSIVNGMIGEVGRVVLASVVGLGLAVGGLRLFGGRYALLGQGLVGAGIATLYFSFYTAHEYGLMGVIPTFVLMILVTVGAAVVALRCDLLLVAVLGLLGGFATPLMIRGTEFHPVAFFGYMLLLGVGVLAMAWRKDWRLLHYLSFVAIYGWMAIARVDQYRPDQFGIYLPYLVVFFVLFSTLTFVNQLVERKRSTVLELLFLFANATCFLGLAVSLMAPRYPRAYMALVTLPLALFYLGHIVIFLRSKIEDRGLILSFVALAVFFVTVTLPLVFSSGWISVSWAVQGFLMLWIASRMKSEFLRQLAYLLYLIVLARFALIDLPGQFDYLEVAPDAAGYGRALLERLIILGIPIGSFFLAGRLFAEEPDPASPSRLGGGENDIRPWFGYSRLSRVCFWIVLVLTFITLHREFTYSFGRIYQPFEGPSLTLLWLGLAGVLLREMFAGRSALVTVLFWMVSGIAFIKVFCFDLFLWGAHPLGDWVLRRSGVVAGPGMRLVDFGALVLFFAFAGQALAKQPSRAWMATYFQYGSLVALFLYTSLEVWTMLNQFLPIFRHGGVTLYWSTFALAMIFVGIRKHRGGLRALGLGLMAGVIGKLFFLDLIGLDPLYRIFAFIGIGLVVLIGSFLYLKYRDLFTNEESVPEK